jgi:preprotein translocase subunit YajC
MWENLLTIAVIVIILWLLSLMLYIYISRQHHTLQQEIEAVQRKLDQGKGGR